MTQNELLYILTIAEHGNITRAAQELFISQPSLSESLSKVEQEFGRPIFHRDLNGLTPTDFGQKYLDTARKILELYRQMNLDLDDPDNELSGYMSAGSKNALVISVDADIKTGQLEKMIYQDKWVKVRVTVEADGTRKVEEIE